MKESKKGVFFKVAAAIAAVPVALLLALFVMLYLPPVQEYATRKISEAVQANSDFELSVGRVRLSFPLKLVIEDFVFCAGSDTIASGEEVATSVSLLPLLRGVVEIDYLSLESVAFDTHKLVPGTHIRGDVGNFRSVARDIDLVNEVANIKQLYLRDANIFVSTSKNDTQQEDSTKSNWVIKLQKSNIENLQIAVSQPHDTTYISAKVGKFALKKAQADIGRNTFSIEDVLLDESAATYDSGTQPRSEAPTKHIALENIALHGSNISYTPGAYTANINNLSFAQHGGLAVTEGVIIATGNPRHINISQVDIKSKNGTYIQGEAQIPLDFSTQSKESLNASLALHIDKRDAEAFASTAQREQLKTLPTSLLDATIAIHGTPSDINIDTAAVTLPTIAQLGIKGYAKNITDDKKREAHIELAGDIKEINKLLGNNSTTCTPLSINGEAQIEKKICYTSLKLAGDGESTITATYNLESNTYDAKIDANSFNLSASVPFVPLSLLSMRASLSGRGTDIFANETYYQIIANIDSLRYSNTPLENITLSAFQANSLSLIALNSYNHGATANIVANSRITPQLFTTNTKASIKNIDLAALGLSEKLFSGAGEINIEAETNYNNTHSLKVLGNDIKFETEKKKYTPGTLYAEVATSPTLSRVEAKNGDLSFVGTIASSHKKFAEQCDKLQTMLLEAKGREETTYRITDLIKELPNTFLSLKCGRSNILSNILAINNIEYSDIDILCTLDSVKGININSNIENLSTADIKTDSLYLKVVQRGDNIKYRAGASKKALTEKERKEQFAATIFGSLQQDTLKTNLSFTGNRDDSRTFINTTTYIKPQELDIHIAPNLYFVGTPIKINPDNHITIGKEHALSANLKATDKEGASLHLYTIEDSIAKHDVTLELYNINLEALTASLPFAPKITGFLSSDIHYRNDPRGEMFSGDIRGEGLTYEKTHIGDNTIEVVYLPKKNGSHYLSLLLQHNQEEVLDLWGDYDNELKEIKGQSTITRLPLEVANAFIKDSGLQIDGTIDGELSLDGNITAPRSDGYINFNSVHIDAPLLGSRLQLVNDRVEIVNSKMLFNNLNIYANDGTPFNVNGSIDISRVADPLFDLNMKAKSYKLVDAPRQKGSILYGNLNLDINSAIKGPASALKIYGKATILGNSNVTYVVPESNIANNNEFDGLVEFVNFQDSTATQAAKEVPQMGNITMMITLDIEESAWINADISPDRSSYVSLQGGGLLNMNYNHEEGLTLTGRYTLNNGEMKYSLPIIPLKTFGISPGSYIYWTGDVLNPTLSITALERVVTPVSIDGTGSVPVTFDVGLVLSNSLNDMGLNFTMKAPENAVVQDELNSLDAETMNKYAVTMLITGAYVGSKGGLTVSNALTSFLDAKINDIAGDAMKNVSINVGIADVENDETGGSYMNYSFSFAKRFWNDRLTIIVGGEVNSGDHPQNNQSFINNVSLEWKINDKGNRYLRLFYDKNYESILEGEITETGVGYIYKRKLNTLDELIRFNKKKIDR